MKTLSLVILLFALTLHANPVPIQCEELAKRTDETFRKMDDALKLKAGLLLGEMEMAKGALEGCIQQNKQVSIHLALIWFLTDLGLLASVILILFHQRRMKRAIRILSEILHAKDPAHSYKYIPSQTLYRFALGILGFTLLIVNGIALLL